MQKYGDIPSVRSGFGFRRLWPVLFTLALHAAFIAVYAGAFGGDLSALVCVDKENIGRWPFESIRVGFPTQGYDGQFYYALARDPWAVHSTSSIDFPAYRHARVAYPALAWLITGGDPDLLLWALPAINLAAIFFLAWFGVRLATHYGRSPWWGCLLPIAVNAGMSALRDLTDPFATATVCVVLAGYLLGWPTWMLAFWSAVAALSREQNVAVILIVLVEALMERRRGPATALAASLLIWIGWVVALRWSYGEWPVAGGNVGVPLSGIWHVLTHFTGPYGRSAITNGVGMTLLLTQIGICGLLVASRANRLTAAVALAGAGLAVCGGVPIYEAYWSYARVFIWMPLGIWLWAVQTGRHWPIVALAPTVFWPTFVSLRPWIG